MFYLWLALFAALVLPVSAGFGGVVTWLVLRKEAPDDGKLLGFVLAATLVFVGASTTLPGTDWFRERFDPRVKAQRVVLAHPVNAALYDAQPWEWKKIEPEVQQAALAGIPPERILARTREQHLPMVRHMLPFAPGFVQLRYARAVVRAMAELRARDPRLCVRLAWKLAGPSFDVSAQLSPELAQAWEAAAGEVARRAEYDSRKRMQFGEADPASRPLDVSQLQLAYAAIRDALQPRYGDAVGKLHTAQVAQLDPATACDASIALFRRALEQEPRVARALLGNMLRD
jgi:hypothetical protein